VTKTSKGRALDRTFDTEQEAIAAAESFVLDPEGYLASNPNNKKAKTAGVYKSQHGESWRVKKTVNGKTLQRTFDTEQEAIAAAESFVLDPEGYLASNPSSRAQKAAAVQKTKDYGGLSQGARANELQLAAAYAAMDRTAQQAPTKRPRQPPAAGSGQAAPAPVMVFISVEQQSRIAAAVDELVPPLPQEMTVKQEPEDDSFDTEEAPEPTQTLDLRPHDVIFAEAAALLDSDEFFFF
jgi:hypothetical protein